MAVKTLYAGESHDGPSPLLWHDCPWREWLEDPHVGYGWYDDFVKYGLRAETLGTVVDVTQGYIAFADSGGTITSDGVLGGGLVLTEATDDESVSFSTEAHSFNITQNGGDLWFEARVKNSTITTNENSFFLGLMDTTALANAVPLTQGGALADINCVGFHKPEANTTAFDTSYKANSVTAVEVNSDVGTLEVATYIKLGMRYRQSDAQLLFYINNVLQASTKTIPNATGSDFPADVTLAPVLAMMMKNSATESMTMSWWRIFQKNV